MEKKKSADTRKAVATQKLVIQSKNTERGIVKNLFLISISLGVALIVSIIVILMLTAFNKPKERYFALDNDLRVIELIPTQQPMLTDEKIIRWTNEIVNKINTLSFTNWRGQLQSYSKYFTNKSFEDFIMQLKDTGNLELIRTKRLNTIVMLTGTSKITKKGIDPSTGKYVWQVETPFTINYEGSNGVEATQRLLAVTMITRVPTLQVPVGIQIKSYVTFLKGSK